MLDERTKYGRRNILRTLGASGASLSLLGTTASASRAEQLEGVAYDMRTHEILADASATVTRSEAGIKGNVRIGDRAYPIDVGSAEHLEKEDAPADQTRFKKKLGEKYARNGVKSEVYLLNRPECLAGWIASFNPRRRMKFDRVGFCLMKKYEHAHNTIGGGN